MTTRLPIVAPIPPFKGGPLQARNAPNTQSHTQAHSSPAKPSQPQPSKPKATTRLEREKKKEFKDPKNIGPWDLGKLIGQGASGRVRLAVHQVTKQAAAVKIIPKHVLMSSRMDMKDATNKQNKMTLGIEREIVIMKLIEHPNLLGLWDVYETSSELFLIMEYVAGGELFDHLVQKGRLRSHEARSYFRQIIFGVDYCHRFNICHRDLKPENLLLDSTKSIVKVADFGMAALQPSERMLETSCGSPHYASPEIVSGKSYKGTASDIWSCGIILFALLCGRLPFDDPSITKLLQKVRDGRFEMPEGLEPAAKDLIWKMLEVDPEKRISMHSIMKHPWFTDNGLERSTNPVTTSFDKIGSGLLLEQEGGLVDADILGNLKTLWPEMGEGLIVKQLESPGPNWQKTFYQLLINHRENHSGADDDAEDDDDEEEEVEKGLGGSGGLGLDLGIPAPSTVNSGTPVNKPRMERRSSTSKKETPRPRRSLDTSRASSPNPAANRRELENVAPSTFEPQSSTPIANTVSRIQPQNASQTTQYSHLVAHRTAPTSPARHHQAAAAAAAAQTSTTVAARSSPAPSSISTPTRPRSNTATQAASPSISNRVPVPSGSAYSAGRASVDTGRPTAAQLAAAANGGSSRPVSPLPPPSPNPQARGSSPAGPRRPSVSEGTSSPVGQRIVGRQSMDQARPIISGNVSPSRPLPNPSQQQRGSGHHSYSSPGTVASRVQAITYGQEVPRNSPGLSSPSLKKRSSQDSTMQAPSLVRRATSPTQKLPVANKSAAYGTSTTGVTQVTATQSRVRSNSRSSATGSTTGTGRSHGPINQNSQVPRPSSRSSSRPPSPTKGMRPTSVFDGPPSLHSPTLGMDTDPLFKDITDQLAFMHKSGDREGLESQFDRIRSSILGNGNTTQPTPPVSTASPSVSTNRRSVYGERQQTQMSSGGNGGGDAQFEDAEEEELEEGNGSLGIDLESMSLSSANSGSQHSPYTPTSPLPPQTNLGLALGIGMGSTFQGTKPLAVGGDKTSGSMVSRGGNQATGMTRRHTEETPNASGSSSVSVRSSSRNSSSTRNSTVIPGPSSRPLSLFSTSSRQGSNGNPTSSSSSSTNGNVRTSVGGPTLGRKRSLLGSSRRNTASENDNPTTSSVRYEQTVEGIQPISFSRPSSPVKNPSEFIHPSSIEDHARARANAKPTRLQMRNPGLGLEINSTTSTISNGPASAPMVQGSYSPRSPNLQTPSTIHQMSMPSPALSITSSSASSNHPPSSPAISVASKGWFSSILSWKAAVFTLYSTENLSNTSRECRRILKANGVEVDNAALSVLKCDVKDHSSGKNLKFRISLHSLAIGSNSTSSSPNFNNQTFLPGSSSPAMSSVSRNSTTSNASRINNPYSTSVIFTLEKGQKSNFENVCRNVRNGWALDSSPTAVQASAAGDYDQVVGLGVH